MLKTTVFKSKDLKFILRLYNQSVKEKVSYQNNIIKFKDHKDWINLNIKKKKSSLTFCIIKKKGLVI